MAHKKAGGSSRNGRDSHGKRLGIKKYAGEFALAGNILVRQRGTIYNAGVNTSVGSDFTIFALTDGIVQYKKGKKVVVSVKPLPVTETVVAAAA